MNNTKVNKIKISSKFNTTQTKFFNLLEQQLREHVSDDVVYSRRVYLVYWNGDNTKNNVKNDIIHSVIENNYKKRVKNINE